MIEAPYIPRELVLWLQHLYPPKCYQPARQTLEDHLQYAGKVDLVQYLADISPDDGAVDSAAEALKALDDSQDSVVLQRDIMSGA